MTRQLTVVGLGTGDETRLTLGIYQKLKTSRHLFLRTKEHPVAAFLDKEGISYSSFDSVYAAASSFEDVYPAIVEQLLDFVQQQEEEEVVYAVPGHPSVAEKTVQLLKRECLRREVTLQILGGTSFLDTAFERFGFDPIDGFQLLDGTALDAQFINPSLHTVIGQIYDQFTASEVKLTLMQFYPDETEIWTGHSLGVAGEEKIAKIPLFELDRQSSYGNLFMIWIPATSEDRVLNRQFNRLKEIVEILRSDEGCPWDREQTHASIRKNLIEETYEVLETIDDGDAEAMREELGDLLLQVMLHCQMELEEGTFHIYDVIETLNEKLIRRHPHVFGTNRADNAEEALQNWNEIKAEEKRNKETDPAALSVLSGVPRDLPALMSAWKIQKKAAQVGFDWDELADVFAKVEEEWHELANAASPESRREELGDLLFAVVNAARFLKIDPEEALMAACRKFKRRFGYIEQQLKEQNRTFEQTDLEEMEKWWQEAKGIVH